MADIEDGGVPPELHPCSICSRTFLLESLSKHFKSCEKNANKKRKIFNSTMQRVQGTELAEYLPVTLKARKSDTKPPLVKKSQSNWKQHHLEFVRAIRAARGVNDGEQEASMIVLTRPSNTEQCPTCDRNFGPKAFDRHIEWCREQQARLPSKSTTSSEAILAKERLDARRKYRAPPLNKSLREVNREKYSVARSGGGDSRCKKPSEPKISTSSISQTRTQGSQLSSPADLKETVSAPSFQRSPQRSSYRQSSASPVKKPSVGNIGVGGVRKESISFRSRDVSPQKARREVKDPVPKMSNKPQEVTQRSRREKLNNEPNIVTEVQGPRKTSNVAQAKPLRNRKMEDCGSGMEKEDEGDAEAIAAVERKCHHAIQAFQQKIPNACKTSRVKPQNGTPSNATSKNHGYEPDMKLPIHCHKVVRKSPRNLEKGSTLKPCLITTVNVSEECNGNISSRRFNESLKQDRRGKKVKPASSRSSKESSPRLTSSGKVTDMSKTYTIVEPSAGNDVPANFGQTYQIDLEDPSRYAETENCVPQMLNDGAPSNMDISCSPKSETDSNALLELFPDNEYLSHSLVKESSVSLSSLSGRKENVLKNLPIKTDRKVFLKQSPLKLSDLYVTKLKDGSSPLLTRPQTYTVKRKVSGKSKIYENNVDEVTREIDIIDDEVVELSGINRICQEDYDTGIDILGIESCCDRDINEDRFPKDSEITCGFANNWDSVDDEELLDVAFAEELVNLPGSFEVEELSSFYPDNVEGDTFCNLEDDVNKSEISLASLKFANKASSCVTKRGKEMSVESLEILSLLERKYYKDEDDIIEMESTDSEMLSMSTSSCETIYSDDSLCNSNNSDAESTRSYQPVLRYWGSNFEMSFEENRAETFNSLQSESNLESKVIQNSECCDQVKQHFQETPRGQLTEMLRQQDLLENGSNCLQNILKSDEVLTNKFPMVITTGNSSLDSRLNPVLPSTGNCNSSDSEDEGLKHLVKSHSSSMPASVATDYLWQANHKVIMSDTELNNENVIHRGERLRRSGTLLNRPKCHSAHLPQSNIAVQQTHLIQIGKDNFNLSNNKYERGYCSRQANISPDQSRMCQEQVTKLNCTKLPPITSQHSTDMWVEEYRDAEFINGDNLVDANTPRGDGDCSPTSPFVNRSQFQTPVAAINSSSSISTTNSLRPPDHYADDEFDEEQLKAVNKRTEEFKRFRNKTHIEDRDLSSPENITSNRLANKFNADSAYSSLNRKSPLLSAHGNINQSKGCIDLSTAAMDRQGLSSSGSESSLPAIRTVQVSQCELSSPNFKQSFSSDEPVNLPQHQSVQKLSKFCHECGSKFPLTMAKFCCECGAKRLAV